MSRWLDNAAGAFGEAAMSTYTKLQEERRQKELLELRRKEEARAQERLTLEQNKDARERARAAREQEEYDRNLRADRNIARALAGNNNDPISLTNSSEFGLTDGMSSDVVQGIYGAPLGTGLPSGGFDPVTAPTAPGAPLPSMTDNILSGQAAPMGLPADEARAPAEMSVVSDVPFDVMPIGPLEVRSGKRGELDYISMARNREQAAIYAARAGRWDMQERFFKEAAKLRNDSVMATINTVTSTWGRAQDFVDDLGLGGKMKVEKLTGDKQGLSRVTIVDAEGNVVEDVGEFASPQDLGGWLMSQSGYRDPVAVSEAIASSKANSLAMTASNREANYQRAQILYNEAQANLSQLTAEQQEELMDTRDMFDQALADDNLEDAYRYAQRLASLDAKSYITNVKVRAVDGSEEERPVNVAMSLVENHKTFPLQEELEALGTLTAMHNKGKLTNEQYKDELADWEEQTGIDPTSGWLRGNSSVRRGISLYGKDDDNGDDQLRNIVVPGMPTRADQKKIAEDEATRARIKSLAREGNFTADTLMDEGMPDVGEDGYDNMVELLGLWPTLNDSQRELFLDEYQRATDVATATPISIAGAPIGISRRTGVDEKRRAELAATLDDLAAQFSPRR